MLQFLLKVLYCLCLPLIALVRLLRSVTFKRYLVYGYLRFLPYHAQLIILVSLACLLQSGWIAIQAGLTLSQPVGLALLLSGLLLHLLIGYSYKAHAYLQAAGSLSLPGFNQLQRPHRVTLAELIYLTYKQELLTTEQIDATSVKLMQDETHTRALLNHIKTRLMENDQANLSFKLTAWVEAYLIRQDQVDNTAVMDRIFAKNKAEVDKIRDIQFIIRLNFEVIESTEATSKATSDLGADSGQKLKITRAALIEYFTAVWTFPHPDALHAVLSHMQSLNLLQSHDVVTNLLTGPDQRTTADADICLLNEIIHVYYPRAETAHTAAEAVTALLQAYRDNTDRSREILEALYFFARFTQQDQKVSDGGLWTRLWRLASSRNSNTFNQTLQRDSMNWLLERKQDRLIAMAALLSHLPARVSINSYAKFKALDDAKLQTLAQLFSDLPQQHQGMITDTHISMLLRKNTAELADTSIVPILEGASASSVELSFQTNTSLERPVVSAASTTASRARLSIFNTYPGQVDRYKHSDETTRETSEVTIIV